MLLVRTSNNKKKQRLIVGMMWYFYIYKRRIFYIRKLLRVDRDTKIAVWWWDLNYLCKGILVVTLHSTVVIRLYELHNHESALLVYLRFFLRYESQLMLFLANTLIVMYNSIFIGRNCWYWQICLFSGLKRFFFLSS